MSGTSLSALLRRNLLLRLPLPVDFTQLQRTVSRILDQYGRAEPPESNPEKLLAEMNRRIREDDWRQVPMSFVTRVARLAFSAPWNSDPRIDPIRVFLLAEIRVSTRAGLLNPMVRIYIETFMSSAASTRMLGLALNQVRTRLGAQWQPLLASVPDLFDPARVPAILAERMDGMTDLWTELRQLGMRQPHAPGLMDEAHLLFLKRIGPRLEQQAEVERLLAWLCHPGQPPRPTGAAEALAALLRPWLRKSPPAEFRNVLVDRVSELYGHPRANRHAAWNNVPEECERLFLHWLTGADIRFLFRILAEVERKHMWRDREDFWWTLYEQGRIDEVWIAFNPDGYKVALSRLPDEMRQTGHRFARQTGEKDKSLLLMRIGRKIVVEGTYSFKVHVFDMDSKYAPKLYLPRYDVSDLRNRPGAETKAHQGSSWQTWVRQRI